MPTTTQLLDENDRQIALLFLIDGCEIGFTDNAGLVGYSTGGSHTIRLGLQRDGLTLRMGLNLATGQLLDSPCTLTITDFEGDLNTLFGAIDESEQQLGDVPLTTGLPITPSEDLAARTDLHDLNVGLERIGASGERHQYAVPVGFDVGMQHQITTPALDIQGAPVTTNPIVWRGRRCALYMVFRDHVTEPDRAARTEWRAFSEARRIWWGTMQDAGTVSGREWSIDLDGPESLLRKPLAASFHPTLVPAIGEVSLVTSGEAREDAMYLALEETSTGLFGSSEWVTFFATTTPDEIRQELIDELAVVAAAAGPSGTWEDEAGYSVGITAEGHVRISVSNVATGAGILSIALHRKVWAILGYDVDQQPHFERKDDEPRYVAFYATGNGYNAPGPGYYVGLFFTGTADTSVYPGGENNNGAVRSFVPLYPGGTQVLLAGLNDGNGQIVRLADAALGAGASQSTVAHPGQLALPVASNPADPDAAYAISGVGNCDRTGFWLFVGKRRFAGSDEVFDERWVAQASWRDASAQQAGLVSGDTIVVTRWLDAKLFGFDTKGGVSKGDWLARSDANGIEEGQVYAIPIVMLGYQYGLDRAHVVLQRLLHTTGTSTGWDSYSLDQTATLDAGDNEPAGAHTIRRDGEIADLGLAIPEEWIADPSLWQAEVDKIDNDAILDVKVAFSAGYQAEDVCRSLMQPAGWSWHLRDGQYGIWCPADSLTLADATVTLTRTTRAAKHSERGRKRLAQDLRKWAPIDVWKFAASWAPWENKVTKSFSRQAPDPQYRYRPGEVTRDVMAHAMRNENNGLAERLLHLSRWWARRHFEVRGYPVRALTPGLDVWPGTIVRLTDPELVDPNGGEAYGVTNRLAIVTSITRTFGLDRNDLTCDLLVLAQRTNQPRVHAPIARGIGYDSANYRIYVVDNWANVEGDGTWADAAAFAEPTYSGITAFGGNALVSVWQWDGDVWTLRASGEVSSVVTTSGAAYLQLRNAITGTYYRDQDTWVVLTPTTTANAAWVDALFSPIGNEDRRWEDVGVATDAYAWEE